ncbi:ABC-type multidrug transport system permease subunit [Enterococcus sp. PF1-24]|uniref:ABC transporter permease n=1 Tax=unclassified Enterococcus TaxID=2608891 RepID=UPI00247550D5|nr:MULTISPECIES: ABC transporter permease [unclassified Enterococcus]MDH6363600.1 ABC-type multidrug transport system permease subunit [Enterococcus sp. PFB1-1]MDH6400835.1 ABC-type multidrug transport system permease subunit [Enterococcus sp. PF1-24]
MRFLALLKGEFKNNLRQIPVLIVFIGLFLSTLVAALPLHLFQRGATLSDLKIAISSPNHTDVFQQMLSFIQLDEHIAEIELLEPEEALTLVADKKIDFYLAFPENLEEALFEQETATIEMYSSNALFGSITHQILTAAVDSLNKLQSSSLTYYQTLKKSDLSRKERQQLTQNFDLELVQLALTRGNFLQVSEQIPQYYLQMIALLLFLSCSIISCYYGILISRQLQQQVFRKLLLYRYSLPQIWLSKLLNCLPLLIPVIALIAWFAKQLALPIQLNYLILAAGFLMLLLFTIVIAITSLLGKNSSVSNVLLVNFVVLFSLLFLGGLIYPAYSQNFQITVGNPAWLTQSLTEMAITGEALSWLTYLPYVLIILGCFYLTTKSWRKSL